MLGHGAQDHAGIGLAVRMVGMAVALDHGIGVEGAGVNGVDPRAVVRQPLQQQRVEGVHPVLVEQTARDAGLVGDDHGQVAGRVQPAHRRSQ